MSSFQPSPSRTSSNSLERLFPGDSEMAARMRAFDWSKTDLGPPATWPQSLRFAVGTCLTSRFPILIWWGSTLRVFYNDAYISFLGRVKHPSALGRPGQEVWPEIWATIGPMLDNVLKTGIPSWSENYLFFFEREIPMEEVYVTFSYSPILGEGNRVEGVFCPCTETTQGLVGARRIETLRKLGIRAAEAQTVAAACKESAHVLDQNPNDVPFAAIYVVDQTRIHLTLAALAGLSDPHPLPRSVSIAAVELSPWPLSSVLRNQCAEDVDLGKLGPGFNDRPWPKPVNKAIVLPIPAAARDNPPGVLVIGVSPRRVLDAQYRSFFDLVAGHIGTAIADAQADEYERSRAEVLAKLDRAKTAFFSNISHEFRTPLTLMLAPLEDALAMLPEPCRATVGPLLDAVHRNAIQLLKLVNALLDFSRIEAGRVQASFESTDLASITAELAGVFRSAIVGEALRWLPGVEGKISMSAPANTTPGTSAPDELAGARILVADDNANMREYLTRLLAQRWTVEAVPDGEAALTAARQARFDLVLTDVMMPRLDGLGLLRALRGEPALKAIPVIMLSARADEETRIEGLQAGADDYLIKPFSAREVVARVELHLKLSVRRQLAAEHAALARLHEVSTRLVSEDALPTLLQAVVDAAIAVSDAHMGNVQLYDAAAHSLRIVAHRGFQQPFLDYFEVVQCGTAICGEALRLGMRVTVEDVLQSPLFLGTPMMAVMEAAGVRAIQSTPMRARSGMLLGMFSTHWAEPHRPDEGTLRILDLLARQAADLIEHRQREEALRKSEAALREADLRKSRFLAVLSHELRNPLAPIKNGLYILQHATPGGDRARRAQSVIARQVHQLARLVDDLLDVTRISEDKIQLARQGLDFNELVRGTHEDHRSLFERNGVKLEFSPAPSPVYVDGDWNRLAQAVGNLLQNAAKFTDRGGITRVQVSKDPAARQAILRVVDSGVGMAPEMLARLFQPFMQADATLDRSRGGLGLGLSLVRGLVELHGGDITAHSAGLGKGAEFVIRLPLALGEHAAAGAVRSGTQGTRRRVLIIEDNIDAADTLREVLEFGGHKIAVACNGPGGLQMARQFHPEVVLCDIGLPEMNGYEVARAFRSDEALKGTFLIALSGYAQPADLQCAAEAGFDRHFAKPLNLDKLEKVLAHVKR